MNCLQTWPEPIVRVQALSESGIRAIPERYIKPLSNRPYRPETASFVSTINSSETMSPVPPINIPVIDLQNLFSNDQRLCNETLRLVSHACREWGFFQIVNHGVSPELMKSALDSVIRFSVSQLDSEHLHPSSSTKSQSDYFQELMRLRSRSGGVNNPRRSVKNR